MRCPRKVFPDSAGCDLYTIESRLLGAGESALVRVDIQMAIPEGYYGVIAGRSGLANRFGVVCFPGTVDAGYRGIVCAILFNFGIECYKVEIGNPIAQIIIQKCCTMNFFECSSVEFGKYCDTERGTDGFGSSLGF